MNCLKRLNCIFAMFCLLMCLCIPVGAETIDLDDGYSSVSVSAKYTSGVVTDVYSVDIEWGSMEFEYKGAGTTWNPETHKYETTEEPTWKCLEGANKVTVTNHSNKPVEIGLGYTSSSDFSGITGTFDITSKVLAAATENSDVGMAPSFTATLKLSGALSSSISTSTVIGTAKVTLSAPDASDSMLESTGPSTSNGDAEPEEEETVIPTEPVGYVRLYPRTNEGPITYQTSIYQQSSNVYVADICAESIVESKFNPDTEIYINDIQYYIYEAGSGYQFKPGTTVNINKNFYDDGNESARRKETVIEAGKTYRLTITLDEASGTGTATLEKVSA